MPPYQINVEGPTADPDGVVEQKSGKRRLPDIHRSDDHRDRSAPGALLGGNTHLESKAELPSHMIHLVSPTDFSPDNFSLHRCKPNP